MNLSDKLKNAIEKLEKLIIKQADEPTLNTATLADGTQIKYPGELAVDTPVIVVTAEGEVPAPDGEHTLEDGTIVKTADGKVTEIMAVQKTDPKPEGTAVEQMKVLQEKILVKQATVEERLANLEAIARVVMEYCYGWELKNEGLEDAKDKAIAAYAAIGAIKPVAEAMSTTVEQISAMNADIEELKARPVAQAAQTINEPVDPLKVEAERIAALQSKVKTRK